MQKVAVKVCENKTSVISMNGGCVGNSCIAHAFIASTYTFFTYSPKSYIKSFSKWSHWRGIGFYCWIIMTKGKYTTKILFDLPFGFEKVWKEHRCRRQGRMEPKSIFFFFFVIHGSISVEMKTMFFEYFSHISLLRHVLKTCQNWIREHFLSIVVHVHTLLVRKSNFFFNYVKHIQFWNFIMICLGTSSSTYITK